MRYLVEQKFVSELPHTHTQSIAHAGEHDKLIKEYKGNPESRLFVWILALLKAS